jgi:hypothetical protein
MKTDRYVIVKKASNGFILSLFVENGDGDEKVKEGVSSETTLGVEIRTLFRTKLRAKKEKKGEEAAA